MEQSETFSSAALIESQKWQRKGQFRFSTKDDTVLLLEVIANNPHTSKFCFQIREWKNVANNTNAPIEAGNAVGPKMNEKTVFKHCESMIEALKKIRNDCIWTIVERTSLW